MSTSKWPEQKEMWLYLRAIVDYNGTQRIAARELECSEVMLSEILLRKRPIPRSIGRKLGYRKVITWEKEVGK